MCDRYGGKKRIEKKKRREENGKERREERRKEERRDNKEPGLWTLIWRTIRQLLAPRDTTRAATCSEFTVLEFSG